MWGAALRAEALRWAALRLRVAAAFCAPSDRRRAGPPFTRSSISTMTAFELDDHVLQLLWRLGAGETVVRQP
jgi:hypothetical protein